MAAMKTGALALLVLVAADGAQALVRAAAMRHEPRLLEQPAPPPMCRALLPSLTRAPTAPQAAPRRALSQNTPAPASSEQGASGAACRMPNASVKDYCPAGGGGGARYLAHCRR